MRALRRLLWGLGVLALAVGAFWLWVIWPPWEAKPSRADRPGPMSEAPVSAESAPPLVAAPALCVGSEAGPAGAAAANAASLSTLAWSPFGKPETGWEIYAPRIAAEIGTSCAPGSDGFAAALARWQQANHLPRTGVMDAAAFAVMLPRWHLTRPFVRVNRDGVCPGAPAEASLATARPDESYGGKTIQLRPAALQAYRRMVAEARAAGVLRRPEALTIYSGFRAPDADAQRCARDRNCQGLTRTICSAHRTGLALDVFIDAAPGFGPDSSADANRLAMARSPLYRWMVWNAGRFGFVNYVYEPWHWEWTGEPLLPGAPIASLSADGAEPVTEPPAGSTPRTPAAASAARNRL
ncbi:peptidase M15 [Caulobacter sp. X]|nr:peptidase M15 [Caulobacter sp. X]